MKKVVFIIFMFLFIFSSLACSNKADIDDSVITIGASVVPHAAILEVVRDELLRQGYTLKIVEFTDYVLPNTSLQAKELDANFFQHVPYLTFFNQSNNTDLVSVAAIHFEPFGIYKGTEQDLIDLPRKTKIAIPNDQSNRARALLLLEAQGLLTIRSGAGLSASVNDITSNPLELEIIELEAAGIPARLADVGLAVINGNYAISANVTSLLIVSELPTSLAATTFANIIVVRRGDENKPAILALISALKSEVVRSFILQNYPNAVYPVF